ncbi:MAG: hypothetical protein ACK4WH_02615 [Phycisphaerales bacterium]
MPRPPQARVRLLTTALVLSTTAATSPAQPVRLELRIVPQVGAPFTPGGVQDLPLTTPETPITLSGSDRTQRFELQYRVLDLDTTDTVFTAGLCAAEIDITVSNANAGTFGYPRLSRFETTLANAFPPPNPDLSGMTGNPNRDNRRGLHMPFRGAMMDQNDNTSPVNGTIDTRDGVLGIYSIIPVVISPTNQGNAAIGSPNDAWFGLYTFSLTAADFFDGPVTITAATKADPVTANRFAYFLDGLAVPETSSNALDAVTHINIVAIPTPAGAAIFGLLALTAARRRRA